MEQKKENRFEPNVRNESRTLGQEQKSNISSPVQGYSYLVRKTEKLTTALYLVTDILGEREPLKWKLRESGVDVLSDISIATTISSSEKLSMLRSTIKKIERVISFLDIASSSHLITEMNAGVLKREYVGLKDGVEGEWSRTQERSKVQLTERFFDVPKDAPLELTPANQPQILRPVDKVPEHQTVDAITQTPVQKFAPVYSSPNTPKLFVPSAGTELKQSAPTPPPQEARKEAEKFIPSSQVVPTYEPHRTTEPRPIIVDRDVFMRPRLDVARDDRRKIILALLKQKPAVTVGDIAKSIPGVSEKTVQRELLSMVAENVLVKHGERRWSTYSLREA